MIPSLLSSKITDFTDKMTFANHLAQSLAEGRKCSLMLLPLLPDSASTVGKLYKGQPSVVEEGLFTLTRMPEQIWLTTQTRECI